MDHLKLLILFIQESCGSIAMLGLLYKENQDSNPPLSIVTIKFYKYTRTNTHMQVVVKSFQGVVFFFFCLCVCVCVW